MHYYCTYFDKNYLSKGLALIESLTLNSSPFTLYVLCLDNTTNEVIVNLHKEEIIPFSLHDIEATYPELAEVKAKRKLVEYYFTLSPFLPSYILRNFEGVDVINYVDADLYFFNSIKPIYDELNDNSILIIPHNFSEENKHLEIYGKYNVGLISFRNDKYGTACIEWWKAKCIEWCHDYIDNGRFGDQKYLDKWPERFDKVVVCENPGANLSPNNIDNYNIEWSGKDVQVNGKNLIFFHYHRLHKIRYNFFSLNLLNKSYYKNDIVINRIYKPYIQRLLHYDKHYKSNMKSLRNQEKPTTNLELIKKLTFDYPVWVSKYFTGFIHLEKLLSPFLIIYRLFR